MRLSMRSVMASQPRDNRSPARNPSRPFHGGWSAMPLMDGVPSRPERGGPAKVIATAIDIVARAVVSALRHCGSLSFLRKQESLCSALVPCFRRDDGGLLLASPKRWGGQVLVRRLGCEREARERPMDGRRSDFRGQGGSSE